MPAIPGWTQFVELLELALRTINTAIGGNPGLAIILFTLIVKVVTLPLTMTSIRSSRRMQEISPLMKEIQKRYKDDKTKQQAEVMRVYQEHGVNPMGSCLPMVVQIPIFLGLYQALQGLVFGSTPDPSFAHAFLWVPTLAKADPYYIWPVLSAIFQFLSQRMSMPYGLNKMADKQQQTMNKIMQFMPLYLLVVYLNFATGAVVYWTFSSIFTCLQTYVVNGFGSLPDVPGFGWLPKRQLKTVSAEIQAEIAELEAAPNGRKSTTRRISTPVYPSDARSVAAAPTAEPKGFFAKMMAQAAAAQEAQAAAKNGSANGSSNGKDEFDEDEGAPTERLENGGEIRAVGALSGGNGVTTSRLAAPTADSISRKRRSKR